MTRHSRPTAAAASSDMPSALTATTTGLRRHSLTLAISGVLALGLNSAGSAQTLPATLDLASLDGTIGFRLDGEASADYAGFAVSDAGDVNGDGISDLLVGAPFADPNGADSGSSYVVFGRAGGFATTMNLAALDGANGFRLDGEAANERSGRVVSGAGDVNGDGFDDVLVGARDGFDYSGRHCYVVFGKAGGFSATMDLASLDGANGFRLDGLIGGRFQNISSAGDVNGDGFDDVLVGSPGADPADNYSFSGSSYVVFGKSGGFAANLNLASLDGANGFRLDGAASRDYAGAAVSAAGDVNGDGFDDVLVGAGYADPNGNDGAGSSYVVFGKSGGFAATMSLAGLDGANGFRLDGVSAGDTAGGAVSTAGDVNDDGFDDVLVGAFRADPNAVTSGLGENEESGSSYVVFGKSGGFAAAVNLDSLDGTNGFRLDGEGPLDFSGIAVSSAADVNGDGFDDLLVGAHYAYRGGFPGSDSLSGSSYLVFGKAHGFAATLALADLDGAAGFRMEASAAAGTGREVSAAGDVNGDGFGDMLIGAPYAFSGQSFSEDFPGTAYVVFGGIPALGLTPGSLVFASGTLGTQSAPQTVIVENTGTGELTLGAPGISGANAGEFALSADTCANQTLSVAASCSFDVILTATITGPLAARIDIPSNAADSPDTIDISAAAATVPVPALNHWVLGILAALLGVFGIRRRRDRRGST